MTTDRDGNRSNPYHPNPAMCCEACVFGRGKHVWFCETAHPGALERWKLLLDYDSETETPRELLTCRRCGEPHFFVTRRCKDGTETLASNA